MSTVFLNVNQNLAKKAQKTKLFTVCKTQVHKKKKTLLQPPSRPKICVFQLVFFETKPLILNKKHNLKSEKKDNKKGFQRENKTGNPKKRKDL